MLDFGFDAFDIFNTAEEPKEEAKKETKKKVQDKEETKKTEKSVAQINETETSVSTTPAGVSFMEDLGADIENEDDSESLTTSDDASKDDKKKPKKKPDTKKKDEKLKGVITVVGNGWHTTYGEEGKEYKGADVAKALYEQGYKEIAIAAIKYTANTLYVNVLDAKPTSDDVAMGDNISIELGNFKVNYSVADFGGLTAKEISIFDVAMKFQQDNPAFTGCGLKFSASAKVACPTFTKKATINAEETYSVWTDGGIQQYVGADIKDDEVYVSDSGTYFIMNKVPKSASTVYGLSLGLPDAGKEKKVVEVYRLPFTLWVETFGTKKACTSADFGGKECVTRDEVIAYLGNAYRIFRSTSRKFSISYDRNSSVVGVAVISGEKGALAAPSASNVVSFFDCRERLLSVRERVEETALGLFKGYENDVDMLSLDTFKMSLPKIPGYLLDTIIKEFKRDLTKENMVQIYYSVKSKNYYLVKPQAAYNKVSVFYHMTHTDDILVMSIHSHNTMAAKFSGTDDKDEIYTGLFGVIGDLDKSVISMSFRAGMEGKFKKLYYADIFTNNGGECA